MQEHQKNLQAINGQATRRNLPTAFAAMADLLRVILIADQNQAISNVMHAEGLDTPFEQAMGTCSDVLSHLTSQAGAAAIIEACDGGPVPVILDEPQLRQRGFEIQRMLPSRSLASSADTVWAWWHAESATRGTEHESAQTSMLEAVCSICASYEGGVFPAAQRPDPGKTVRVVIGCNADTLARFGEHIYAAIDWDESTTQAVERTINQLRSKPTPVAEKLAGAINVTWGPEAALASEQIQSPSLLVVRCTSGRDAQVALRHPGVIDLATEWVEWTGLSHEFDLSEECDLAEDGDTVFEGSERFLTERTYFDGKPLEHKTYVDKRLRRLGYVVGYRPNASEDERYPLIDCRSDEVQTADIAAQGWLVCDLYRMWNELNKRLIAEQSASQSLVAYRVMLHEEPGDKFQIEFECQAEDADHAAEQAENAYPGCQVIICVPVYTLTERETNLK